MPPKHRIQKQIIELQLQDTAQAYPIQEATAALCRTELPAILDACCNALSPSEALHRIDKLVLDLGHLDTSNLKEDFIQKFTAALQAQLTTKIEQASAQSQANQPTQPAHTQLEALSFFIHTGLLPWWAKDQGPQAIEESWQYALQNSPQPIKAMLRQALGQPTPISRIIRHLSDKVLFQTLQQLFPRQARLITQALYKEVCYVLERTPSAPTVDRVALWKALLRACYTLPTTHTDGFLLLQAWLSRLAQDTPLRTIIRTVQKLQKAHFDFQSPLPEWIQKLPENDGYKVASELPHALEVLLKRLREQLQHPPANTVLLKEAITLLQTNALPAAIRQPLLQKLEAVLNALQASKLTQDIAALLNEVKRLGDRQQGVDPEQLSHLAAQLRDLLRSEDIASASVTQLQALSTNDTQTETSASLTKLLRQLEAALQSLQRPNLAQASTALLQAITTLLEKTSNTDDEAAIAEPLAPIEDVEEIYINNAGLILLWPYLNRLFEKLALVQEKAFVDGAATEKAILILQYLADGTTTAAEHQLILNKLLCGVDVVAPIAIEHEFTAPTKEACEDLLTAVIAHWSMLKNISVDGFRQAYLQREGVLTIRDGAWLLRAERKTYDIIVDNIPWPIHMVKLPWMHEGIIVEW